MKYKLTAGGLRRLDYLDVNWKTDEELHQRDILADIEEGEDWDTESLDYEKRILKGMYEAGWIEEDEV